MKVVLFCGGRGTRIRDYSDQIPKPMVPIGYRPILWHVMKYYAHFGHTEFILCLGYQADVIKKYFLDYDECLSNDFVLLNSGQNITPLNTDIQDWKITFVDTGVDSSIGERLKAIEPFLKDEEIFLANYSDGLTDYPLQEMVEDFARQNQVGSFLCVRPKLSYHVLDFGDDDRIRDVMQIDRADMWINGGYYIFRREIFDYIGPGEDLVYEPFARLVEKQKLTGTKYDGFWMSMDTFKENQQLHEMFARGETPWMVWKPELGRE